MKDTIKNRMSILAEEMSKLSPKIDSGRYKYSEKQRLDRYVEEYLLLEKALNDIERIEK